MKSTKQVAFLIATLVIIAAAGYYWFTQTGKHTQKFSITGEWEVDSVFALKPSQDTAYIAIANAFFSDKKKPVTFQFNKDSTFTSTPVNDSGINHYAISGTVISMSNSKEKESYSISVKSDSLVLLIDKDSIATALKKIK